MAIYLDANLLYSWRTFSEVERIALSIVAQQIHQPLVVPAVAAWEAEAHYRRSLESAVSDLKRAHRAATDAFRGADVPALADLDIDARVTRWAEELGQIATIIPLDPADAAEAYRREAFGIAPGKRRTNDKGEDVGGKGGRDAAIWLTVVRDHRGRNEEGHFVSKNTSDFGKTSDLNAALKSDLADVGHSLNNYGSLDDFLAFLGNPRRDYAISLEELNERLPRTLRVVLPVTTHIPRAIFGSDYDWEGFRYVTEIKEARATKVLASRRYEQEDAAITVINALCELVVDCVRLPADEAVGPYFGYESVRVAGSVQAYVPDGDERLAQVISARFEADELPQPTHGIAG
jgi:hypothetical protein